MAKLTPHTGWATSLFFLPVCLCFVFPADRKTDLDSKASFVFTKLLWRVSYPERQVNNDASIDASNRSAVGGGGGGGSAYHWLGKELTSVAGVYSPYRLDFFLVRVLSCTVEVGVSAKKPKEL
jgi:hypothetical protein